MANLIDFESNVKKYLAINFIMTNLITDFIIIKTHLEIFRD